MVYISLIRKAKNCSEHGHFKSTFKLHPKPQNTPLLAQQHPEPIKAPFSMNIVCKSGSMCVHFLNSSQRTPYISRSQTPSVSTSQTSQTHTHTHIQVALGLVLAAAATPRSANRPFCCLIRSRSGAIFNHTSTISLPSSERKRRNLPL